MSLGQVFLSEVVGTAILIVLGVGVVANVLLPKNGGFGGGPRVQYSPGDFEDLLGGMFGGGGGFGGGIDFGGGGFGGFGGGGAGGDW